MECDINYGLPELSPAGHNLYSEPCWFFTDYGLMIVLFCHIIIEKI